MFGELESVNNNTQRETESSLTKKSKPSRLRFYIIVVVVVLLVLALVLFLLKTFLLSKSESEKSGLENSELVEIKEVENPATSSPSLPILGPAETENSEENGSNLDDIAIEYLSFNDFYNEPEKEEIVIGGQNYSLPLNAKLDVANYYTLTRKVNLDLALSDLNEYGFAVIDNPWPKEAKDFGSFYSSLESRQIPLFLSADFIISDYQNTLKKVYKEIEEKIFYTNLWDINKELYLLAKKRYETRLAAIGNVNDSLLEAFRLQTVFFSVSLELLKPEASQISTKESFSSKQFTVSESEKFYFSPPLYIRDDVLKEVALIKAAKENTKSPTLLYKRDYKKEFTIPKEYDTSARLKNLYLVLRWLNSNFPLNYQGSNCSNCLLDKEDWRLTTIAASFIALDFSESDKLKNSWARIYKLMSFFNPIRDDLNYVVYRDSLREIFGEEYDLEKLFADNNEEAQANLHKLRDLLDTYKFSSFLGAFDLNNPDENYQRGFKFLSLPYSPGEYVFKNLTYPLVDTYEGEDLKSELNITACLQKSFNRRCLGSALDFINLVLPIDNHPYFEENTNYLNYNSQVETLRLKLIEDNPWQANNYWSTLYYVGRYLNSDKNNLPSFASTSKWQDRELKVATAAWINTQLPLEFSGNGQGSLAVSADNFAEYSEYSYIEPNLELINELLASNKMISKMLLALQINKEAPQAFVMLQNLTTDLEELKKIVKKELSGESLSGEDNAFIISFSKKNKGDVLVSGEKKLTISFPYYKNGLKEDLSQLKLMVIVHQEGDGKFISAGPVWDYIESR